jgi:hypothetical protein
MSEMAMFQQLRDVTTLGPRKVARFDVGVIPPTHRSPQLAAYPLTPCVVGLAVETLRGELYALSLPHQCQAARLLKRLLDSGCCAGSPFICQHAPRS